MDNKKIAVVGTICLDATPGFYESQRVERIGELMKPGKLINIDVMNNNAGGVLANTGLALKKFGSDVVLVGKHGDDAYGQILHQIFESYDAAGHLICGENESTSYTLVIAPPGIDRIFLHHMGANATFNYDDIDFDLIAQCGHFHFGYPTIMRRMYLDNASETERIFQKVKELGLTTSLDMTLVEDASEAGKEDWKQIVKNLMPYVDFFVPSVEEIAHMIDKERYQDWIERAAGSDVTTILDIEKDVKPLAETLLKWGAKCVLIKCGVKGMYLRSSSAEIMRSIDPQFGSWGDLDIYEASYVPDRILSGTGAGDASIAAFLKAALEGYTPQRCLQFATATGASCITEYDSLSGLLSFEEMEKKIDAGWKKNLF